VWHTWYSQRDGCLLLAVTASLDQMGGGSGGMSSCQVTSIMAGSSAPHQGTSITCWESAQQRCELSSLMVCFLVVLQQLYVAGVLHLENL